MNTRWNSRGEINVLLVPLILVTLMLFGALGFGYWAYTERQDYKNNSDQKSAAAAAEARRAEGLAKDKAFIEAEKLPLTSFDGPSAFGSIHVEYPKTWSVYVGSTANQPFNAFFNPRVVPSIQDQTSVFALRLEVEEQPYNRLVSSLDSQVKQGRVTVTPYTLPKVTDVVGVRVDGLISPGKKNTGSMVILPLRDKTIKVWTENAQSIGDFNNIILQNLTFSP